MPQKGPVAPGKGASRNFVQDMGGHDSCTRSIKCCRAGAIRYRYRLVSHLKWKSPPIEAALSNSSFAVPSILKFEDATRLAFLAAYLSL